MNNLARVSQSSLASLTIDNLQRSLGKLQTIQGKLSSGKELNRPSDNPSATSAALQYRTDIRRGDQYSRNAQDGLDRLGLADATLTSMMDQVHRARDLALKGANASMSPEEREAMASEVDTIREGLIAQANADYLGHPIFAGTFSNATGTTAAYDSNGVYLGDNGALLRTVGKGTAAPVSVTGPEAFGTGSTSLFAVLGSISTNLRSANPTDTANLAAVDLGNLDTVATTMQNTLAQVGARYNRLDTIKTQNEDRMVALKGSLADVEDIDLPKTITDLTLQQTAYQAALAATAKMIQPSLVDFLK
jgi:flagellar hook-associated protein 3 FlgL